MQYRILKLLKAIVAAAVFAVLRWKGIGYAPDTDPLTLAVIVITALGVAYSACVALFRVITETTGGIMVLANFLNQHLMEPLKEQQREQGREQGLEQGLKQGRQAERDRIRAQLRERGLDLDELLPPTKTDRESDRDQ